MSLKKHFIRVFIEFIFVFGLVILFIVGYNLLSSYLSISIYNLIQVIYLISFLVFRMESMVNFHQLDDHLMQINYWISSILSDISFILLLSTLNRSEFFIGKEWFLIILYFGLRLLFYLLMHIQSLQLAKKINEKLKENQL